MKKELIKNIVLLVFELLKLIGLVFALAICTYSIFKYFGGTL